MQRWSALTRLWAFCCGSAELKATACQQQPSLSSAPDRLTVDEFSHNTDVHSEASWQSSRPTTQSCGEFCSLLAFHLRRPGPHPKSKETFPMRRSPPLPRQKLSEPHHYFYYIWLESGKLFAAGLHIFTLSEKNRHQEELNTFPDLTVTADHNLFFCNTY